jgi:hypothetical protein
MKLTRTTQPISKLLPLQVQAVTAYTMEHMGGQCPACKAAFASEDMRAFKDEFADQNAVELTVKSYCQACRCDSTARFRFVASHLRLDSYAWDERIQRWTLVGWRNASRARGSALPFTDLVCMLIPCMIYGVLPPEYQSTPNFAGLFLIAWLASRVVRALGKSS